MAKTKNKKTHYATTRPRLLKAKAAVKIMLKNQLLIAHLENHT